MKNKLNGIILTVLIVLAAAWCAMWYMRKTIVPKMQSQNNELLITANNTKTSINDLKGNVTMVSFFQTWCGPCAQEISELNALSMALNSDHFKILCISDEDKDLINAYQKRLMAGNVLLAHSKETLASLGVYVYPTTYLLNKKGEVIRSKLEGYDWALEKATIEKLLSE